MTDDTLLELVREDIRDTRPVQRLQTMCLTLAIGAFGAMLGVHWFAARTFSALTRQTTLPAGALGLQWAYSTAMWTGAVVVVAGFVGVVVLDRYADEEAS